MKYNLKKPSADLYSLGRGDGYVMIEGTSFYAHMGDNNSLKVKPEFKTIERNSKNFEHKTTVRKDIIKRGGTLDFTIMQRTTEVKQIIFRV